MGRKLQKFWKYQVLFAKKSPLVMGPTALHPIQQLYQAWEQPQSQEGHVVRNIYVLMLPYSAACDGQSDPRPSVYSSANGPLVPPVAQDSLNDTQP